MSETRTYQGHTYTRNGPGEPWVLAGPAPRSGVVITDPYRAKDESRKDQSQQFDAQRIDLTAANNAREAARTRVQNPQDLRKEYETLDEVKRYRIVLQQAKRAMGTADNPQGDLALTYAVAQAFDPIGSVREGDQASIADSQPKFQALVQNIKKQFNMNGAGSYTPEARTALRREIFSQISSLKPLYERARADMADNARAVGVDPKEVIGREDTSLYAPDFRSYGEKVGDDGTISRVIGGDPIKGAEINLAPPATAGAAGYGATKTEMKIPDAMQKEYATYVNQNWGKLDPQAFADFRAGLDAKYGFGSNVEGYRSDAIKMNEMAAKGTPPQAVGALTAPDRELSTVEQLRNDAISNPVGAGIAGAANMGGLGIPSALAGDKYSALRKEYPKSVMAGEIAGGILGANKFGGIVRGIGKFAEAQGAETVAKILAKPLAADVLYGGVTGANDAYGRGDNVVVGALTGSAGGAIGNKVGTAIGKVLPSRAVRALDQTVPTSNELKTLAGDAYSNAESKGLVAAPADTLALADTTKNILLQEGRLSPTGRLTDVQPKVKEAYNLIDDYADQPMTPTQIQTVRGVIADGGASVDPGERRIARMLLDNFDTWTDGTNPELASGLRDARGIASRYLQGDKIASMRELAEPGAGQYTQSGMGNALRTQYRGLDRAITRGSENFAPNVEDAVRNVARGDPLRNSLRYVGKLAPTGQMGMYGTMGATLAGGTAAGPVGGAVPLALAGIGTLARKAEMGLADRAATVAENSAYGGQDYSTALIRALSDAGRRGGSTGAGVLTGAEPTGQDLIARLLLQQAAPQPVN